MNFDCLAERLAVLIGFLAPYRSSCGLKWLVWGPTGSIVECHPPDEEFSVDFGIGLDEPVVTIDSE